MSIFLDANVLLYAAGAPSRAKEPCSRIVEAAGNTSGVFVTDAEVLQEALNVMRRRQHWDVRRPIFFDFSRVMTGDVLPMDHRDVERAARHVDENGREASTRDLVHLAIMQRHGIERVVSADRDFDGLPGVTRLDPLRLDEWADPGWFPTG